nr:glycoside hydrolase family 38 C-terminal domain-containing protein [Candidatus Sigynarchaeum springense]
MNRPPSIPNVHVIAQSHIDLAWLWRWDPETVHVCCKATFGQATASLDACPDYVFSQSQVPLYRATEQHHPEIFKKMEHYIKEGRWEIVGGMFVEFEGAEPCGESLVRQCVLGKRYFKQRFGVDVTTGWQEDAWTHPWQLPQILVKCGMDAYFFKRGRREPQLFWWQSPDGSRVLAVKPAHVLAWRSPFLDWFVAKKWIKENVQRYHLQDVMIRIGKGDHGGGPSPREIAAVRGWSTRAAKRAKIAFGRFDTYKNAVLASDAARQLPVLASEIDCELQGDLTNCGELKARNRHGEVLLLTAEKFSTIAAKFAGLAYPKEHLERAWERLLFNQFHDIIGGSGIPEVCADAHHDYDQVEKTGQKCLEQALDSIASKIATLHGNPAATPLVVFNPLSWDRTEFVTLPPGTCSREEPASIVAPDGRPVLQQRVNNGAPGEITGASIIFKADVPSIGYSTYFLVPGNPLEIMPAAGVTVVQDGGVIVMENEILRVEIDMASGNVGRIWSKQHGRELLDGTRRGNGLVAVVDNGDSEGRFEKHRDRAPRPVGLQADVTDLLSAKIVEKGPVRAAVEVIKRYQASMFVQTIMLHARDARVDFSIDFDWHDVHRMVKVAFPFAISHPWITYHTQFGSIERPADGCEYPAQYWIDVSCQEFGVLLLNDARHAHDVEGSQACISLLRSPTEPARNTDEGRHVVRYSLVPHAGPLVSCMAMREGYAFNHPLVVISTPMHQGHLPLVKSFLKDFPPQIIVETIKQAFDSSSTIVRCFNASDGAVEASIEGPLAENTMPVEVDMLERQVKALDPAPEGGATFKCMPSEIKTIELR